MAISSGTCGDNLTWTLDDNYTLTISGTGNMTDWSSYGGVPWYSWNSSIKTIIIDNGVTSIGKWAFYGCTNSSLTNITIPDSVTSIGNRAFFGCSSITQVTIGNGVTNIGDSAFYGCQSLASITIPDSVISIGSWAFDDTAWWDNQPIGLMYAGKVAYRYKGTMSSNTSITLANNTKGIAGGAFSGCSKLTSITIPDSVTSIGSLAFVGCSSLTAVIIPNSVTSIGESTFNGCSGLSEITLPFIGNGVDASTVFGYIFGVSSYSGSYIANGYYIPNELKNVIITNAETVSANAFKKCQHIEKIVINETENANNFTFGNNSFEECAELKILDIRGVLTVSSVGENLFESANSDLIVYCYKFSSGTNPIVTYCEDNNIRWAYNQVIQGNEASFKLSDTTIADFPFPVQYFYWEIFDDNNNLIYRTNKVFSGDVQMTYSNFFPNKDYVIRAHVIDTEEYEYVKDLCISCWIDGLEPLTSVEIINIPLEFDTGVYLKIKLASPQGRSIDFNKIVIKRENITFGRLENVCTLTPDPISGQLPTEIIDYGAKSGVSYMYYLYLTGTEEENNETVTKQYYVEPTSSITPEWDRWMLFTANEISEGEFEVDDMFIFSLNISSGQMTNNGAGQAVNNFTLYPRIQKTTANYWSGALNGLMGYLDVEEMNYIQNDEQLQALKTLNISDKPKFLKDRDGHLWKVELVGAVTIDNTDNLCFDLKKKSINWVEIGDASNASLVITNAAGAQWLLTLDGYSSPMKTYVWDNGAFWDNGKIWTHNFGGENNG